jgi:hypothetical protein
MFSGKNSAYSVLQGFAWVEQKLMETVSVALMFQIEVFQTNLADKYFYKL